MNYIAISIGAVLGALSRHALFVLIDGKTFPYHTLIVNVLGCFLAGIVVEYLAFKENLPLALKLFFITGFLGSFTTFSSLALDCGTLIGKGELLKTLLYVGLSVSLGLAAYFAAAIIMQNIVK